MAEGWRFEGNERVIEAGAVTLRGVMETVMQNLDENHESRGVIHLSQGDPTAFPSFRTTTFAEDAVCAALRSARFNGYSSFVSLPAARRSHHCTSSLGVLVYVAKNSTPTIELALTALARPGANILLPQPGYPDYEARAAFSNLEIRQFDLIPDKEWEVDLASVEALADQNIVAIVIINPGNPCGNVFQFQHLKKIVETARKLGILVIADEDYGHLTFGKNPFVPMGVFASIAPIITLGSLSKRWIVPGWRIGWLVLNDLDLILAKHGIVDSIKAFLNISSDPVTFIQAALPEILLKTPSDLYDKSVSMFRESAEKCYKLMNQIPCISCPTKPQGCMFLMIKLNLSMLEDIKDDLDFCCKLAKEESVILVPGIGLGLKNWVRVTFVVEPSYMDDGSKNKRFLSKACQETNDIVLYI